jgi:putative nucleotidyltransferase with HDIG domain
MSPRFLRQLADSAKSLLTSHVRSKIVAPYIVLTLLLAAVGTYLATQYVTGSLQDRFDNQLAEAARVTSDSMVRREREHLSLVRSMAFTVGVPGATEAGDAVTLRRLVEPRAANDRLQYVEVFGANAESLVSLRLADVNRLTYEALGAATPRPSLKIVPEILAGERDARGDKFAELARVQEDAVFYTGGPIRDAADNVVGAVVVGTRVSSLLPAMKHEALADITVYDHGGRVLGSTFAADEGVDLSPSGVAAPSDLPGMREIKSVLGRDYDLLYGELRIRGEAMGLFSVALPSSFISSAASTTRLGMVVIFSVAIAAVVLTGFLIARGVTAPLIRLLHAARAVSEGDLTARSGVRGADEVGELATSFDAMTERLAKQHLSTIRALSSAIDARDPYTAGHSVRVGQLAVEIGRNLELPNRDLQFLEIGGYLHDVGKIGIRDNVLLKPGLLTPEERVLIQEHPRIGLDIVQHVDLALPVREFVIGHHERLDGSGYPYGLAGDQVSVFARVGAVADMYDALTTARPYKPALTIEQAVRLLQKESKEGHLDERVVMALVQILPTWSRRLRVEPSLRGFLLPEMQEIERDLSLVS